MNTGIKISYLQLVLRKIAMDFLPNISPPIRSWKSTGQSKPNPQGPKTKGVLSSYIVLRFPRSMIDVNAQFSSAIITQPKDSSFFLQFSLSPLFY